MDKATGVESATKTQTHQKPSNSTIYRQLKEIDYTLEVMRNDIAPQLRALTANPQMTSVSTVGLQQSIDVLQTKLNAITEAQSPSDS